MKTHMSFATSDIARSVDFYQTLLGAAPAKSFDDYALFVTDDPGLELALDRRARSAAGENEHYGLAVESVDEVERAIDRLTAAGHPIDVERDELCCYAKQTKVWASDPDGRRWEVYAVLEESDERDGSPSGCCSDDDAAAATCCA